MVAGRARIRRTRAARCLGRRKQQRCGDQNPNGVSHPEAQPGAAIEVAFRESAGAQHQNKPRATMAVPPTATPKNNVSCRVDLAVGGRPKSAAAATR